MPLIFIVDDDADTLLVMEYWLKRKGFSVKSFRNSSQMLQDIQSTIPDIILLDVHLNGEDGREICMYLKHKAQWKKPIFLLSTNTDGCKDYTNYLADGFMEKPYYMKDLAAMIQSSMAV